MHKKNPTTSVTSPRDRLSYLWLALALVLLPFAAARWSIPLATWLYPVFLLRFVRTQSLLRGMLLVLLGTVLVLAFAWQGSAAMLPFPGVFSMLLAFGAGILVTLPYLIDRVVAPRLGGMLGTLVFPLAVTTLWYLSGLFNPSGTWLNPAYTQYGDLPLLQLLSVTGLWGIVLVMSWFASVVNWAWERGFAWPRVRGGAALYGGLLALVLLFGGARLALFPAQASTVRVAGISPSQAVLAAAGKQFPLQDSWNALISGKGTQADRQIVRQHSAPVFAELLVRSEQEARAGAKIIVWPECSGGTPLLQEDEAVLLGRAGALAQASGIYLDLGMCVLLQHPVQSRFFTDETALIGPKGLVLWRYEKAHPTLADPVPPGDGKVPTVQTPYGRLSNVICADGEYPGTLRQAGQAGADIMLMPSNDPTANDPYNTQAMTFRAIENGFSEVRQTSHGLAMAVDYEGNVLAASDYSTTDPQVLVADIPVQGARTIYATIGDLFAWLSVAGLVVLIGVALARRRQAGEEAAAEPITASPAEASPERAVTDVRL
jgi:apolipoprotein N-acyltransferase